MRILFIVEPERKDWYDYLRKDASDTYILLWHEGKKDIPGWIRNNHFFNEIHDWNSYLTPGVLLKKIRPDRIVFFEIIDQRQIALLVKSNRVGVKTFYLEHGAAGDKKTAIERANEPHFFLKKKSKYLLTRIRRSFGRLIRSKLFYYSAVFNTNSLNSFWKYLRLPVNMLFQTPNKALANCIFQERQPYKAIVFNKPNFEQFQVYTGITEEKACFTGVPMFDKYYSNSIEPGHHILYIDHPYLEEGLFGWTKEHHKNIALTLKDFANKSKRKLYVKLHPRSNKEIWDEWHIEGEYIKIIREGDFTGMFLSSKLILGFSSSLINGFLCARKNVVLLGWHPSPRIIGNNFADTGLCHYSLSPADLDSRSQFWFVNNLAISNKEAYDKYLKAFNFPFDGKANERVLNVIKTL